jgi:hypothetical protein
MTEQRYLAKQNCLIHCMVKRSENNIREDVNPADSVQSRSNALCGIK